MPVERHSGCQQGLGQPDFSVGQKALGLRLVWGTRVRWWGEKGESNVLVVGRHVSWCSSFPLPVLFPMAWRYMEKKQGGKKKVADP